MQIRRVVTGVNAQGQSVVIMDGPTPHAIQFQHTPGYVLSPLWATFAPPVTAPEIDPLSGPRNFLPKPGETRFQVVTFPPDHVAAAPEFDPERAKAEVFANLPGLAETFEADDPAMHQTQTVDYAVVLVGEIWLDLGEGGIVHLRQHDTVVQNGARHAWRNLGNQPASLAFVMTGVRT